MTKLSALPTGHHDTVLPHSDARSSMERLAAKRSPGALCHGIRFRLYDRHQVERVVAHFPEVIRRWLELIAVQTGRRSPRLWVEFLPAYADSPAASRRRRAEFNHPVQSNDPSGCRAVLLQYDGGVADLILIAHRTLLDGPSLRLLGRAIMDDQDVITETVADDPRHSPDTADLERAIQELRAGNYSVRPEWGLGGEQPEAGAGCYIGTPLPVTPDRSVLLAAIGFALSRFNGHDAPVIAMLAPDTAAQTSGLGGGDGVALLPLRSARDTTVAAFIEAVRSRASALFAWHTPALTQALAQQCEDEGEVAVGLWWDMACTNGDKQANGDVEYRGCLAPPFPLSIELHAGEPGLLRLSYTFERNRFSRRMVETFDRAVVTVHAAFQRALLTSQSTSLSAIPLLDASEASQVAALGRPARPLVFESARIEQCVAEIAASQPDAPAVTYAGRRLSYRELDSLSNQMAHGLRELGVHDSDRVGVCLERSFDLVPTLLAVMKAGATYVPMDPAYPAERLSFTARDAGLSIVVSSIAPSTFDPTVRVLTPDRLLRLAATEPTSAPIHCAGPDSAAYVIYTSGSIGRPKGVVVPHRNVAALIATTRADFALSRADTWTLFHSTAFDFSVWEIWGCLATGGHLVVVPYLVSRSPDEFIQLLARERVTVLSQTPSAFAQLQEADRRVSAELSLRLVVFGGEPLDSRMLLRWFDRHPESECRLVNMFGITETTVHVTAETVTRQHALTASRSVGRAIPGWHFYVMDPERRLLPVGVPGEIYVGGAGVALQYLNRAKLTAERFLNDPFARSPMYRSGDKGRLRADGRLEHLGRLDDQIKIRGFRVELDEIRSVLLECPAVTAAAVVLNHLQPNDPASARLDAYVVLDGGNASDVRLHVSRVLPEYMIPTSVTALPALPLTTNGKLDIKRLPPPTVTPTAESAVPCRPDPPVKDGATVDTLEQALQRLWSSFFRCSVGLDDNFFELGGNSLYAVRIAVAMREQKLPSLTLRDLYTYQTIRRVAAFLCSQLAALPEALPKGGAHR